MADKTRAERIEEAARDFYEETFAPEHDRHIVGALIGHRVLLGEALSLPPDPPRGDGWAALRELRDWIADEANGRGFTVDTVFNRIDRLLAAAPKEPEPEPAESPVPAINMSGSGELSFDWWCGERNLTVFGENVTFLASHNAEPHEMIDGKVADLDHLRELQKWVADGGVVPQRGPQLDESPAEPAQDDEAAIEAWLQRIGGVSADCHRMPAYIDVGVYGAMQSGYAIMCRLAREKADLRAKLAAAEARIHDLGEMLGREIGRVAAAEARIAMRDRAVLKLIHNSTGSVIGMGTMLLKDDAGYFEVHWARGVIEDVSPAELGKGGA